MCSVRNVFGVNLTVMNVVFIFIGRSYLINSQRVLVKSLESLVQKVQPGVVINFEKLGPPPPIITEGEISNKCICYSNYLLLSISLLHENMN